MYSTKFLSKFPDVNANWLLTGEGEMLSRKENNENIAMEPILEYGTEQPKNQLYKRRSLL